MQKILFTNSRGQTIEFSELPPYILTKVEGLGDVESTNQTQKSYFQDGSTYKASILEERFITLEISIISSSISDLSAVRQNFASIFNPKLGEGIFQYRYANEVKEIDAVPEHVPFFPSGSGNRIGNFQKALVTLRCPNPYFRKSEIEKTEIALWEPRFEFPLEIIDGEMELGIRSPSLIVNVLNDGHVETGMMIHFKALGTVVNPSLFNVNTREFFKLNKTMLPGEVIIVNTNKGRKRIESTLNGVTTNIFNYRVFGSKFMQLEIGDNLFRYDADNNVEGLEVVIYHSPQFVGV